MAQVETAQILSSIRDQRINKPLSIIDRAEPLLSSQNQLQNGVDASQLRQSNASSGISTDTDGYAALTPDSLNADLAHYKDLFSKLRFSYLEQVTKEKYLRGIVGEPPTLATSDDNAALEEKLSVMKTELQSKKRGVETLVAEMEEMAHQLAQAYDNVNENMKVLENVPREIDVLEQQVAELRRQLREKEGEVEVNEDPRMNMSLEETDALLTEQRRRNEELSRQIEELQQAMPVKMRECERAERELEELEGRRNEVTRLAREVQRIREEGGRDPLEEQGRWYKSSEMVLQGLLGVQA